MKQALSLTSMKKKLELIQTVDVKLNHVSQHFSHMFYILQMPFTPQY